MHLLRRVGILLVAGIFLSAGQDWGFFAHRKINELAVYTLPAEVAIFYKHHIRFLSEHAVDPDKRRRLVEGEAPRHYIDLDVYGDSARQEIPKYWTQAVEKLGEDSLLANGIVPWAIYRQYQRLKEAFLLKDPERALKISADLGHYVADSHVPLHTTSNYDGQYTKQRGMHSFWESRLPELFFEQYDFFVGRATYVEDVQAAAWDVVYASHAYVDTLLLLERQLFAVMGDEKYTFEQRGKRTVRVVARRYAQKYHQWLDGMVEERMRKAVKMTGDLWYTAWVDGGQPDMKALLTHKPTQKALQERRELLYKSKPADTLKVRPHEAHSGHH